jgi:lycopene cyclase CruA
MIAVLPESASKSSSPDLADLRRRYPLTVTGLGALPNREAWLGRISELEQRWLRALDSNGQVEEVIVQGSPPAELGIEGPYDIVYAGGVLGLLHAAVMAACFGRRVLVFDADVVGQTYRDWNIADEELSEFQSTGLLSKEEIEQAVANRYGSGFVKFHDAKSRIKAPPLWMNGVLDVAIRTDKLLSLAAGKLEESETGSAIQNGLRLVRCWVQPDRVVVEVENTRTRARKGISARLFVDASGTNSPVSRQLIDGRPITHVCPTVGTVAKGFVRGNQPDAVDFKVGEILVSNEDARDHRQLIWEGLAGDPQEDEYTTCLFFYDAVDSRADKSLLALFERYFESLPRYKRKGVHWRVVKPVFGYVPGFHNRGRSNSKITAEDRVMLIGDSASRSSHLTFCGFSSHVRNVNKLTTLTEKALAADALTAATLKEITAFEPRFAQMVSLSEFMRPTEKGSPSTVNETLNAVMSALHSLDERVRRELFQDRMSFDALKNLLSRTARLYPQIFNRIREHLGLRGTFWWLANIADAALSERRERKVRQGSEKSY